MLDNLEKETLIEKEISITDELSNAVLCLNNSSI